MREIHNVFLVLFILSTAALIPFLLESVQGHLHRQYHFGLSHFDIQDSDLELNVARPHLDYERCAQIHNKIVELGWKGYFPNKDPLERKTVTWWDRYGETIQSLTSRLNPSMVEFLKRAELPEDDLSFTFNLRGLSHPSELWNGLEDSHTEVLLYSASQGSHPMGLVFNQEHNLAEYSPTIFHHSHNDAFMYPLEITLTMYLSMINSGKIVALPDGAHGNQPYSKPWVWRTYSDTDVKAAVGEFTDLIDSIISRVPMDQRPTGTKEYLDPETRSPLVDKSTLHALNIPHSFLSQFLSRAPKPPFPFIAPGLTIPTRSSLSRIFASVQVLDMYSESTFNAPLPPTLLFPSNVTIITPQNSTLSGTFLFGDPQTTLDGLTSGLYIVSQSEHYEFFTNGVKLVLPFPLGAKGFAKKANWEPIGSNWDLSQNYTDLYQMGSNSFIDNHAILLDQVFRSWRLMVEEGVWEVDEMGVKGGMEAWKMADDEEHWWRFKMDGALW